MCVGSLELRIWVALASGFALDRSSLVGRGDGWLRGSGSGVLTSEDIGTTYTRVIWSGSVDLSSISVRSA
jgi:photosystem II stability/assembly factor-like uncharacterized protein